MENTTLPRKLRVLGPVVALLSATLSLAAATENILPPDLVARGWEEIAFDGKRSNRYAACGVECIEVKTDSSVSMIGRPVSEDITQRPILTWEWKIETPVYASDLTKKGEDDRSVAVYVTFPYDPETATFSERLMRPAVELMRGVDAPSRMLSYVWGGYGKPGDIVESPFFGGVNAMIISRTETDPVGSWLAERADIFADHMRVFGSAPQAVAHVLIGADSDDTETRGHAFVRNIGFLPK